MENQRNSRQRVAYAVGQRVPYAVGVGVGRSSRDTTLHILSFLDPLKDLQV
jgi:hypothetical protein